MALRPAGPQPAASTNFATWAGDGASGWDRTTDACAFNAALYQLSYRSGRRWRTMTGSNRRPSAGQADTLATELMVLKSGLCGEARTPDPMLPKQVRYQLRYTEMLAVDLRYAPRTKTKQAVLLGVRDPLNRQVWARSWWKWPVSNRRPSACKAGALPTELHPRNEWWIVLGSNQVVSRRRADLQSAAVNPCRPRSVVLAPLTRFERATPDFVGRCSGPVELKGRESWCAKVDSNHRHPASEAGALSTELPARNGRPCWARTSDTRNQSPVLYQLS